MKSYRAPDGLNWGVEVSNPGSSNAMVLFHHPDGRTAGQDRYNWYLAPSSMPHDVTARLDKTKVLEALTDREIAMLFRRSMPVTTRRIPLNPATGYSG